MLLCTRLNFQGDSGKWWFCVLHLVHFSRILILWQALSLKKQIRGWNWKGYHRVFFLCNDWYKWKGKGCLSHLLSAPLGMVLLVDIFPQGETHTDRLDWVACLLPPSPLLISLFLFLNTFSILYFLLFFLLLFMSVMNFYEESWRWLPVGNYQRSGALCLMNVYCKEMIVVHSLSSHLLWEHWF